MVAISPVDKLEDSNLGGNAAAERGKAVKLAKGGAFQLQTSLISALSQHSYVYWPGVTLLFRSEPLSLPKNCTDMKIPFNRQYFRQQRSTMLLGGN